MNEGAANVETLKGESERGMASSLPAVTSLLVDGNRQCYDVVRGIAPKRVRRVVAESEAAVREVTVVAPSPLSYGAARRPGRLDL